MQMLYSLHFVFFFMIGKTQWNAIQKQINDTRGVCTSEPTKTVSNLCSVDAHS